MFHLGILPVIAMALISGITAAVSGAAKMIPGQNEQDQNARRKLLLDKQTAGTLGLTPKQIQDLTAIGMSPVQTMAKEDLSRQGDLLSTLDMGAGSSLIQADLAKEATRKQALAVGIDIARQNLAEANKQEAELQRLQEAKQQRTKEQIQAGVETAAAIAGTVQQAYQQGAEAKKAAVGGDVSKLDIELGKKYGFSSNADTAEARSQEYQKKWKLSKEQADMIATLSASEANDIFLTYYSAAEALQGDK